VLLGPVCDSLIHLPDGSSDIPSEGPSNDQLRADANESTDLVGNAVDTGDALYTRNLI
jgi:hypothetical protein